ncbi:hypothetical protein [Pyxidicoccus xibeiensis]|uniref:hypothetical protein n=1 Tax=Pyxidicoccus xibeiensis TaxID=2906759 RepID=UPI0020A70EE4|nr:hypothetical protein [Pyxidicoccus xibeiensis]MCP3139566.1 hypothetical protein [Pyxidicoccus xibeiensis]
MSTGNDSGATRQEESQALAASSAAAQTGFSDREVGGAVLPCEAGLRFRVEVEAEPPPVLVLTSEVLPPAPPPGEGQP